MSDELRQLDAECARALGWTWGEETAYSPSGSRWFHSDEWRWLEHYSSDPTAARLLEDEIERRCLYIGYVVALLAIIESDAEEAVRRSLWYVSAENWFQVIRATPEQKASAFLKAVEAG